MLACTAARAATHLEAIGIEELGVIGGVGVVEAEGCHRVPGVVPLGEHAEVCQGCEELGHVCDCTPNGTTNVAVELQWNNASPALRQCSLNKHRQLILMQTYRRSVGSRTSASNFPEVLHVLAFTFSYQSTARGPVYEKCVGSRPAGLANGRAQADKALVAGGPPDGVTGVSAHADHGVVG